MSVRVGDAELDVALELGPKPSGAVIGFKADPIALVSWPMPRGSLALVRGIFRGLFARAVLSLDWPLSLPPLGT